MALVQLQRLADRCLVLIEHVGADQQLAVPRYAHLVDQVPHHLLALLPRQRFDLVAVGRERPLDGFAVGIGAAAHGLAQVAREQAFGYAVDKCCKFLGFVEWLVAQAPDHGDQGFLTEILSKLQVAVRLAEQQESNAALIFGCQSFFGAAIARSYAPGQFSRFDSCAGRFIIQESVDALRSPVFARTRGFCTTIMKEGGFPLLTCPDINSLA